SFMFSKSNEELNLSGLAEFIEKPSYACKDDECKQEIAKIVFVLSKNPSAIMNIIANHPDIPATFLLDDLADKMGKQNCLEKLGILFDTCLEKLVESCIYNLHDLERCIKAMPTYSNKVMEHIISNESQIKRILMGDNNLEGTIKEIEEKYPNYKSK